MLRKYYLIISVFFTSGIFSQNTDYLQQLRQQMSTATDTALGNLYFNIGNVHLNKGQYDSADVYFNRTLAYATERNYPLLQCRSYSNLGLVKHRQDNHKTAMEHYLKALQIAEKHHFASNVARLHINMGEMNLLIGDTAKGLAQLQKAEQMLLQEKDSVPLPALYSTLAHTYLFLGPQYDKAQFFIDKALTTCNILQARPNLTNLERSSLQLYNRATLIYKGELQIQLGQHSGALATYALLRHGQWDLAMPLEQVSYYNQMASVNLKQQRYNMVLLYTDSALAILANSYQPRFVANSYELRAKAQEALGNFKAALSDNKRLFAISDSLSSSELATITTEMQAKYEVGKKDARIEELRKAGKQQTIIIVLAIIAAVVAAVAFLMTSRARRLEKRLFAEQNNLLLKEKELAEKQMQVQVMEGEQMALRAQMNPHFIFNSLNSLQYYVINSDLQGANKYISMLGSLIRLTLDYSSKKNIPLSSELSYITNYMELEKLRIQDAFVYRIHVAPDINADEERIPPLLLQPFVENAIRHGIRHLKGREGVVEIEIDRVPGALRCTITDNGIGRAAAQGFNSLMNNGHHSKGIGIVEKRLALLKSEKGAASFAIEDVLDGEGRAMGTKVVLLLPV